MPAAKMPDAETPAIEVVGLDADDTLWHDERMFVNISDKFHRLLEQYLNFDEIEAIEPAIEAQERANLALFGYGVKAYTLSLIETAIASTDGKISAYDIHQIVQWGKEMLSEPVELLDGVEEVVAELAKQYRIIVITKGDLWNQEEKLARSGLEKYLEAVEVVAEKDAKTYQRVLRQHGINPKRFVMAGNSLKSDIAPVLTLGAKAVHIRFPTQWALEQMPADFLVDQDYITIETIRELPEVIDRLLCDGAE